MRKIFSLFSKIKIRVISKQPQDLNIYEWQSQIGLCIIISEPKKTLKYSLFFVENHQTRSLQIKKKISWFCDGKNYGKLQMVKFSHRRLSQGRWIVFREKNYEKKICWNSPFQWLTVTFVHCIGLLRVAVTQLHVRDLSIHWHYVTDGGFAIFGESRKRVVHDGLEIIRHAIINNFSSPFPFGESVFETWRRKTSEW